MKTKADELHKRGQDNLTRFLQVEVELAHTFLKMSETTDSPDHRARLLRTIREAIKTIERFESRIDDASVRAELRREAAKLQEIVFPSARSMKKSTRNGTLKPTRNHTISRALSSRLNSHSA
jgi:hypothetical protein